MRAVVQDRYGDASALRVADFPVPRAARGEVLVRVHATSLHADVWHVLTGRPYLLARPLAGGLRRPRNAVPGTDMAGVVADLGSGTSRFAVGDRVLGEVVSGNQWHNGGTFAEYVAVDESLLTSVPDGLSFAPAAAIPTSGLIAYNQVRVTHVEHGDRVLVNGAAGGVGLFVVQLAKAKGADVTAVDAADRGDLLLSLGADRFLDYRRSDFTSGPDIYDAIIDIPGNQTYRRIARVLAPDGRYTLVGHDRYGAANRWIGSLPAVLGRMLRESLRTRRAPEFSTAPAGALAELVDLAAAGALRPVVAATYPLERVAEAVDRLVAGDTVGKIVLTV